MTYDLEEKRLKDISAQLSAVAFLQMQLSQALTLDAKMDVLDAHPYVQEFLKEPSLMRSFLSGLSAECAYVIKSVIAIGQGKRIFYIPQDLKGEALKLRDLLDDLMRVETFYEDLGGIVGYHLFVLKLLRDADSEKNEETRSTIFHPPSGIDIRDENKDVRKASITAVKQQMEMGEIYPLGGAGDRLQLKDELTERPLPASKLTFMGNTLLEGLMRDLQAREYLHFKIFGKQIVTPLAIMTSYEKDNHSHVLEIFEKNKWFGRPKDSIKFFCQPSVPTFTKEGNWCLENPLSLLLKPGGHGVVWKLALQKKVFHWFEGKKKEKVLIRQINNPIAGIDYGVLAFIGFGHLGDKAFGFASCPRKVRACEGVNILKERKCEGKITFCLSNIEYCDFKKYGIEDVPISGEENYSQFPSNTNVLFAKLSTLRQLAKENPYPGILINFKENTHYDREKGFLSSPVARIELTMQNISDGLEESFPNAQSFSQDALQTYLTFNHRHKTISAIKKGLSPGDILETAEGCFKDYLRNARELLSACGFKLPEENGEKTPSFLFSYHPALGPFYSIIKQKIQRGRLAKGSELLLEIADVKIENLDLHGSLCIETDSPLGNFDEDGKFTFSSQAGRCTLINVKVENQGIDFDAPNIFWKSKIIRKESLFIKLKKNAEFIAEGITFKGNFSIEVPENHRCIAKEIDGQIQIFQEQIQSNHPFWEYSLDEDFSVLLSSS